MRQPTIHQNEGGEKSSRKGQGSRNVSVYYATRFINALLVTSFNRHKRSECLIKRVTKKFINELHIILFLLGVALLLYGVPTTYERDHH
jgi:hypothetical protein